MAEFITRVNIPEPDFRIDYQAGLFFMGSCFSDNVGNRVKNLKFKVCHNPFGVVYNPLSLANNLQLLSDKKEFTENDLDFYNELWFSFAHYTLFSDPDKDTCLKKINRSFAEARERLQKTDVLFLTLGTSWAYRYNKSGVIVSNCHKIPSKEFTRIFSTTENTVNKLEQVIEHLRSKNPGLKIVFTISPVRHWKDGAIENQRSKSALILAVKELENSLKNIYYFPAYEIFMDELRDYRFYTSDMLHPSEVAIDYIWNRFSDTFFAPETISIIKNVEKISKSLQHRPHHTPTEAYRKFQSSLIKQIDALEKKYSFLNFSKEKEDLKTR